MNAGVTNFGIPAANEIDRKPGWVARDRASNMISMKGMKK
jgi:hypothetical protein